ncbi:SNF2 family N-terminal domain-containing protein [Chaetomium fimeti]|uniref:SNF2 family N-terminal domain-containing protein n=1 Tax=Chaetomium fimeti TaxID=1854472 RepID=A0AAE0HCP8_9PEZI|nr:SNF2 family N-terminal domain-containing protein [Chaetomium fimeti]
MIPEDIEGRLGNPPAPTTFGTQFTFCPDSSSAGDMISGKEPLLSNPDQNSEPVFDGNVGQPDENLVAQVQGQERCHQNDHLEAVDMGILDVGDIDARSDGSSENGLFVQQDPEIKIEDEDDGGHRSNGLIEEEEPAENDRRSDFEEYNRGEDYRSDEHPDGPEDGNENSNSRDQVGEDQPDRFRVEAQVGRDNDSECMFIEAEDIPESVKARFAEFEFCKFPEAAGDLICIGSTQIKVEEPDDDLVMVDGHSAEDPDFVIDEDDILSDGERPNKRHRAAPKRQKKRDDTQPLNPRQAMIGGPPETGGKGAWQEPTDDELMEMYTEQEHLNALKAKGPLTFPQRAALARITAKIAKVEDMASQHTETPGVLDPALVGDGGGAEPNLQPPSGTEGKKARRLAKTAQEYWEREYAEKGSGVRNMAEATKRKRATKKQKKGNQGSTGNAMEGRLFSMLKDVNPIMARAAQAGMAMPGPIQATTREDHLKAMKDFLFRVTGNPGQRGKSDDQRLLEKAAASFGHSQVRASNGKWCLAGKRMISTLYSHQLVGVSWMLGQEFSPDGPYGGILADQMGLGKTVQVLATMSVNRPTQADVDAGCHQTLIVAPATAISQWEREINKHCDKSFIKLVHHYRASQKIKPEMWKTANVILASFNEVTNALPSDKVLNRITGKKAGNEEWQEEYDEALGELLKHQFFRVVLDEGHAIRNDRTRAARACFSLTSKYRWILSGTPIHNSTTEFYTYFRFLGAHWSEDYTEFAKQFGNIEKDDVKERLDVMIRSLMLRRCVDEHFLGAPILDIPPTNKIEAVGHLFLLEGVLQANFTLEDFNYIRRQLSKTGGKTPMHRQLERWVDMEYNAFEAEEHGSVAFGRSRFGDAFNMDTELEEMEATKSMEEVVCRVCFDFPVEPQITDCGHTFCEECIAGALKVKECCPACNTVLWNLSLSAFQGPDRALGEKQDDNGDVRKPKQKKKKTEEDWEVGDDRNLAQPKMKDSSKWIKQYDKSFPHRPLQGSSKTIIVKNQILKWQKDAPDDKVIVFVNWAKLACIIGRMLHEEHIPFLYYFGDLTKDQKEAAILNFQEKPDIKVLVASIRCGGQALNLNFANRVILVDQWWNTAMENQAFGRVHRIGQEKETYFTKIVVQDSVDQRLVDMQEEKSKRISSILKEGVSRRTVPTLEEVVALFGAGNDEDSGKKGAQEDGEQAVLPAGHEAGSERTG